MFGIRERVCFEISRRLIKPVTPHNADLDAYQVWREAELRSQWEQHFPDVQLAGKDLLDFGCGFGNLSFLLAGFGPKSVIGIDLHPGCLRGANERLARSEDPAHRKIRFLPGAVDRIPFDDRSFDLILAFDCMEHVEAPERIMREWRRVLRPGGRALIWWSPYRGPYGPHMESLVPIPWAHVIFGETAMLRTAERIYDLPEYAPRQWDLDEEGRRLPNKWRQWRTFKEQGYINQLTAEAFLDLTRRVDLEVPRFEARGFQGTPLKRTVSSALLKVPGLGEYLTSYYLVEVERPRDR